MTARWDDQFSGRVIGGPDLYDSSPKGAVLAAPVTLGDETVGFLFCDADGDPDSAGLVSKRGGGFQPKGSGYWLGLLRELRGRGVPAPEAVRSLLGAEGPEGAGRVGTELQPHASKFALDEILNFAYREAERGARSSADVSRSAIDAVLRGEVPPSQVQLERIASLDAALAVRPTPDPVVVALTPASARIPEGLSAGDRVHEPAFLTSYLAGAEDPFLGAAVVVRLRVPAGVPALFQEPPVPSAPGVLLLGRGIEWEVDRVVVLPEQTLITAHVVDVRVSH